MRKLLLLLTILFGLSFSDAAAIRAQEIQFGIDFATIIPQGGFKENINSNGYGIGLQFAVSLGPGPFHLGADAGFVTYGSETRREPLIPTVPEVRVDVKTTNNIGLFHLLLRLQPRSGAVRPYADVLVGFKYLFTETTIEDDLDDVPLASETNFSDFTFSYGFGGGVQIRLARLGSAEVALDGKVRYLRGSKAEYLRRGSIRSEGGVIFFDVLSSRTDVVAAQFGVTFRF
ncbi:MAG TPA: outer membrane beta-barrel protein [Blastocatellia bacterium]|nr:outer membrane beta-barrel protein [Blastocatellia bacterium]